MSDYKNGTAHTKKFRPSKKGAGAIQVKKRGKQFLPLRGPFGEEGH